MKTNTEWIIRGGRVVTPSPYKEGLSLIRLGLGMIADAAVSGTVKTLRLMWVNRPRNVRDVQRAVVYFWFSQHNYTSATASEAWWLTASWSLWLVSIILLAIKTIQLL